MKQKNRVVIFVTQLESGGAQLAAIKLTQGLSRLGFDAKLFFLYKKSDVFDVNLDYKIISRLKPKAPLFLPILYLKLSTLFFKEKPRTAITFTHYANIVVLPLARVFGVKNRIASQRNPLWSYPLVARVIDSFWGNLGVYTRNVMVSPSVLKSFQNMTNRYLNKVVIIPNGFDSSLQKELATELRSILKNIDSKYNTVVTVGRLAAQKNQKILVEALPYLPSIYLVILGKGEEMGNLKMKADELKVSSRVKFLDSIPNTQMVSFMSRFNLIAFPSIFEGMSNVLIESLFCGVPIVASSIEENKTVLKVGENKFCALLASPHSVRDWVEKINITLNNPRIVKSISYLALERSKSFTVGQMTNAFSKIIDE